MESYKYPIISFEKIESIDGSLIIRDSPELVRVEASNLNTITGELRATELTSLSLLSLDSLMSVKSLYWKVLPILSNVVLNGEIHDIELITISDTSLTGFSGFSTDKLLVLDINNNRFLDEIVCNVKEISNELHIASNARELNLTLPNLKTANNMSIHDVQEIDLTELESVEYSVSIINNYFTSMKLDKLKKVGGTLNLSKNSKLSKVEFPNIFEIGGGLVVADNPSINIIDFFSKLTTIGGAIELSGPIKEVIMPLLKLVKGSAKIKSSDNDFDCSKWSKTSSISMVVRGGKIECTNAKNEKIISDTPTEISENSSTSDIYTIGKKSKSAGSKTLASLYSIFLLCIFGAVIGV